MERSVPGRNPDEAVSTQRALHVCYGSAMDEAVGVAKLAQVSLRSVYVFPTPATHLSCAQASIESNLAASVGIMCMSRDTGDHVVAALQELGVAVESHFGTRLASVPEVNLVVAFLRVVVRACMPCPACCGTL